MAAKKPATLKRQARETTGKTTAPAKVPQPHGGALNAGGTPGNRGGGRPRDEVRALLLHGAEAAVPKLMAHLESGNPDLERSAAESFLRYGVGTIKEINVENVRARVRKTLDVIRNHVSPEQLAAMLPELKAVWA